MVMNKNKNPHRQYTILTFWFLFTETPKPVLYTQIIDKLFDVFFLFHVKRHNLRGMCGATTEEEREKEGVRRPPVPVLTHPCVTYM